MKKYKICRNVLHKLWSREIYNVEANSEEEAYKIMIKQSEICKKDITLPIIVLLKLLFYLFKNLKIYIAKID